MNMYHLGISFTYIQLWRPPSLSELTPMIFDMGLTHLGSEASKYQTYLIYVFKRVC